MSATTRLVLLLLFTLVFLAKTESKERTNTTKRGVIINAGSDARAGRGSSGDNGGYRGTEDRAEYGGGGIADHLAQGFNSGSGQAGSDLVQALRVTRPIPVPQSIPVTVNRHVPVAVPQPYPVTVPKPYPVAVPHPVTVPVPRPYPVTVPRPVPVPVPHPVGVPVPKPYPVPVPVPVPVPSPFLVGGGIPFSGLGGEFLSLGHGATGHGAGVLLAVPEGHGLTTGYGHGLSANGFSHVPQLPLLLPGFEPSSSGSSADGNTREAGYNSHGGHHSAPVGVPGSGLAPSFSYVEGGKGAPPPSPALPAPSRDGYHYSPT